jgi:predicted nucleic acid-binding protein
VTVSGELADASGGHILWSRAWAKWRELLAPECQLTRDLADAIHAACSKRRITSDTDRCRR